MKRGVARAWTTVATILSLAVALVWLRSWRHNDQYLWAHGQELRSVNLLPGAISYGRYLRRDSRPEEGFQMGFHSIEYGASAGSANVRYAAPSIDWTALGFDYAHHQWLSEMQTSGNWTGKTLRAVPLGDPKYLQAPNFAEAWNRQIPLWPALLLLLWWPIMRTWQRLRCVGRGRRRALSGQCPHCGYDLRAARDRCPECGAAVVIVRESPPADPPHEQSVKSQ